MGFFDFIKEAGEKVINMVSGNHLDQSKKLTEYIKNMGFPGADDVKVEVIEGKATVYGENITQELKEKILVAVGNVAGITSVEDKITALATNDSKAESKFYTVVAGDTLSKIAKEQYGNEKDYLKIFEANKPMLTHPDKIYPGQKLIIPQ
ncbi:MAG TPA: peptidoglycan-binding protein LysM [Arsenophonus nasoniae]|uniref:peptidoglycan-binding protein LysM n=1 Tax=Arsenophonus nasoniae TaxID=638 RepID=UPI0038798059